MEDRTRNKYGKVMRSTFIDDYRVSLSEEGDVYITPIDVLDYSGIYGTIRNGVINTFPKTLKKTGTIYQWLIENEYEKSKKGFDSELDL